MDINSLLSPSESPAVETPPLQASPSPHTSPHKRYAKPPIQHRKSSGLSKQLSPGSAEQSLPSLAAHNAATAYQNQQGVYGQPIQQSYAASTNSTTPLMSPNIRPASTPIQPPLSRQGSTPGMDTLADLASMQHQQHAARQNSIVQRDPQTMSYSLYNLPRSISGRSSTDITMTEAPSPTPRVFVAQALSDADCQTITELGQQLADTPFDFTAHVRFINLLRKGFTDHAQSGSDPHSYELLTDLRDARQTMDRVFSLGEALWVDWLNDEKILCRNIDDRARVMEYFRRAVTEEPSSAFLWRLYGDYMYYLWATTYDVNEADGEEENETEAWSAEDKEIGKEVFKWEPMMDVWEQGVFNTQRRLNDSNIVWDRYMEMLIHDQSKWPSPQKFRNIKAKFAERLATAHASWDQTFQLFSSFVSKFENEAYESTMVATNQNKRNHQAKSVYQSRETHELSILKAANSGDETAEWLAYSEYLSWEVRTKGVSSFPLINGLYERATIRFSSVATLWIDYVEFLIEDPHRDFPVLAVIDRATRHCPWSGDLWSQRLLTMEAEGKDFSEIETTKHDATVTGLLDVGGIDELMKVYIAWCGCLRRRAFEPGASEDELDIAEVAIRSALEHVKEVSEKKDKIPYADPQYRLERIHIKFLTQRGDVEAARANWDALVRAQSNSYDFWYRYYIWEMVMWAKFAMRANKEPETQLRTPERGTAVLREALNHVTTMDWPEQLMSMYVNHCEQHESVQQLRKAVIAMRKVNKIVALRREKEAAEAAAAYQEHQAAQTGLQEAVTNGKRKRDSEASASDGAVKKTKPADTGSDAIASSHLVQPIRDREHASVIVKNLPAGTTESRVRQYFRDCGVRTINSIKMATEEDGPVATVEFETQQDAMFAQIKAVKPLDGHDLKVEFGSGTTLWVTNYPAEADKEYLRSVFNEFGEIVDIRFPSLKGNTRRRFCYVQFLNPEQARHATSLHEKDFGNGLKLQVKISDPTRKLDRKGGMAEGREVYVKNVNWQATEYEIKQIFSSCGTIESVRIPTNYSNGQSMGIAYVVFENNLSAVTAVQKLNNTEFKQRTMTVELSQSKAKRTMKTIIRGDTASPSPNARSPSVEVNGHSTESVAAEPKGKISKFSRSISLLNVPDTVTPARVGKLFETYGALVTYSLRPDHAGAMAEYIEESSVGKAMLGLDGMELDGNIVHTGEIRDLFKQKPAMKPSELVKQKRPTTSTASGSGMSHRPAQPSRGGLGGGRRGGLGFKKGLQSSAGSATAGEQPAGGKSNDYFKNLMSGGKKDAEGKGSGGKVDN